MLAAAREVAAEGGVRAVTLTAIGVRTGMHKSAVLRYFDNREALLLTLCQQEWQAWAGELAAEAVDGPDAPVGSPARVLSSTLERRPLFCDLLAQTPVLLEREAPVEAVRTFKLHVLDAVDEAAGAVQSLSGGLGRQDAVRLVGVATSLAGTLWHVAHPPAALRQVYSADPRLSRACVDFEAELAGLLDTFLLGLTAQDQGDL